MSIYETSRKMTDKEIVAFELGRIKGRQEQKQEWISVKDGMPEDDLPKDSGKKQIDVLVAIQREDDYGWLVRSQTRVKDKFWTDLESEWNWGTHPRGEVTHWMPLPEPPEKE